MSDRDEHEAYVLHPDGVDVVPFARNGSAWTNTEEIRLGPGRVLDFGNGLVARALPADFPGFKPMGITWVDGSDAEEGQ